jgi:hypothetical protein
MREVYFAIIRKKHPKIANLLSIFWKEHDFHDVASKFLLDSRDGTRQGFSLEVVDTLLDLMKLHDEQFGAEPIEPPFYYDKDR